MPSLFRRWIIGLQYWIFPLIDNDKKPIIFAKIYERKEMTNLSLIDLMIGKVVKSVFPSG